MVRVWQSINRKPGVYAHKMDIEWLEGRMVFFPHLGEREYYLGYPEDPPRKRSKRYVARLL